MWRDGLDRAGADGVGEDGRFCAADSAGAAWAPQTFLRLRAFANEVGLIIFSQKMAVYNFDSL